MKKKSGRKKKRKKKNIADLVILNIYIFIPLVK